MKIEKGIKPTDIDEAFAPYAWPGCYPVIFMLSDGSLLCAACAKREYLDNPDAVMHKDVFWEGPSMYCDDCGTELESAYGDPSERE